MFATKSELLWGSWQCCVPSASAGAVLSSEQRKNCYLKPGEMLSQGPGFKFSNAAVSGRAVVVQPKAGGQGLGIFGCVFDQCAFHAVLE